MWNYTIGNLLEYSNNDLKTSVQQKTKHIKIESGKTLCIWYNRQRLISLCYYIKVLKNHWESSTTPLEKYQRKYQNMSNLTKNKEMDTNVTKAIYHLQIW